MSYVYRQDLNWLVSDFTARVADVAHAAVVSADGVPLALSDGIPEYFAEQLAAITSGLASLMQGAARIFEAGQPTRALVEMEGGLMFVMAISDGTAVSGLPVGTRGMLGGQPIIADGSAAVPVVSPAHAIAASRTPNA